MDQYNTGAATKARPTMLTVLCVLSFAFGSWSLFEGYKSAFTNAPQEGLEALEVETQEALAEMDAASAGMMQGMLESAMDVARKGVENAKPIGYSNIALALISIFGVWRMWNLRKQGFWLYVLATFGGVISAMVFLGGGMVALMSIGFTAFIGILFVVLYAVNLKHMH
jgi:hypothetical protein